ncbi:MAG: AP2/ERF family transcription factor [Sedimentisphaerales bacterium]
MPSSPKNAAKISSGCITKLCKTPPGLLVDHFNRNGLDNRRANLRLATRAQNSCNTKKQKGCSSKFKGVCFHKNRKGPNPWDAYIDVNNRRINLGCFPTEISAARAYDSAAKKYHGEFARLNFP